MSAPMPTDLTFHIRRLQQVSVDCGVAPDSSVTGYGSSQPQQPQAPPLSSTATSFEKGRYNLALKLRDLSGNIAELNHLENQKTGSDESRPLTVGAPSPVSQTKKSLVGVEIRKGIKSCKEDLVALREVAKAEGRRADYESLKEHIEKTEQMYKGRFRVANTQINQQGEAIQPVIPEFNFDSNASPLLSLHDDPEFQAHFVQVKQNDQEIDQAVEGISVAVGRLGHQAQGIHEEVTLQIGILEETDTKVTKIDGDLKQVNKKLKKTIVAVDTDNRCIYLLCLLLLLIVLGALVYVAFFDKKKESHN